MGSKLSSIYSPTTTESSYFLDENTCFCSSKYWNSFQMDLNIALTQQNDATAEQEIVTIYFRCSNCEAEFPLSLYYFDGEFRRQYGSFKKWVTFNDRISVVFCHDSLKNILFILSLAKKIYTSKNFAIDLYKALCQFKDLNFFCFCCFC